VLVNGCTGGIGHIAVQIAKAYGAHVTGTCRTASVPLARSLGVDEIVDYTQEDIRLTSKRFDQILETSSSLSFFQARAIMSDTSNFLDPDLNLQYLIFGLGRKHYHPISANVRRSALLQLTKWWKQARLAHGR